MPAPIALEVHRLQGTVSEVGRVRQDRQRPPTAAESKPRPPRHLCAEALAEFKRIAKILAARRTSTSGDYATLAVYSEIYSRWVAAKQSLSVEGLQIEYVLLDSNGQAHVNRKLNPLLKVVESCELRLLALLKSLGLTPQSREAVKQVKEKPRKTRGITDL